MQINADLSLRAFADSRSLPWLPSPLPGVDRRMLDRKGDEIARATSLVRYAPGSAFSSHRHALGEEFLVIDGVFTDETGDFPEGMYVRNPPGSRHTPSSAGGCTILVKLRQMHPEDNEFVRLNTRQESLWKPGRSGESILPLYSGHGENVRMLRWESGANFPVQRFDGGVEYFLINGSFQDACGIYADGAWLRLPRGSDQSIQVRKDTLLFRKTGHLI
jgi:anti-sigma factor ChrR (cupin superfamily)